ncbi:hypothetical protein AB4517_21420, partial [Vibrio sp. 10N.222.52.C3]
TAIAKGRITPSPELGVLKGAEAEAFYLGVNAVIWGYPIVFFEDLIRGRAQPDAQVKTALLLKSVEPFPSPVI